MLAVLGAGLAARDLRPDVWWVPQAAALVLPAAVVASVPLALAWTLPLVRAHRQRSAWAWAAAGLHVALATAGVARLWPEPHGPAADGARMRVLSLNAGQGTDASRLLMANALAAEAPALVAIQEASVTWLQVPPAMGTDADSTDAPPDLLALPPVLTPLQAGGRYRTRPSQIASITRTDQPVFASPRPRRLTVHSLGSPADDGAGAYSRAVVVWERREIAVYNVHLRSFGMDRPWESGQARGWRAWRRALASFRDTIRERARESERLRRVLSTETRPYLVAGDFNSTPHQWSYAHLARGHADALAQHGQPLGSATFPDSMPLVRIDAVLASPHWTVEDAWVGAPGLSDHRAVWADLRLRTAAGG